MRLQQVGQDGLDRRGGRAYRCRDCRRCFTARSATPFAGYRFPPEIIARAVRWDRRYRLSYADVAELLAEMFRARGFVFTREAVREWEERSAPLLTERLRAKRRGRGGTQWHTDETYSKVNGQWCYRYRASDRDGNLVDARRSSTRDMDAAQRCFRQALAVAGDAVMADNASAPPYAARW